MGKTIKAYAGRLFVLSLVFLLTVTAIIFADLSIQFTAQLSPRLLKGIGKSAGGLAGVLGVIAAGYYIMLKLYIGITKKKLNLPPWVLGITKSAVTILRLLHPAAGITVLVFALIHSYLMWQSSSAGLAASSGLFLLGAITLIGVIGIGIMLFRSQILLKSIHILLGIMVLVLYIFHNMVGEY